MFHVKQKMTGVILLTMSVLQGVAVPVYAANSPEARLASWSKQMSQTLNLKMENKIQQIVLKAQHVHQLELDTRNLLTSVDDKIDCDSGVKVSNI